MRRREFLELALVAGGGLGAAIGGWGCAWPTFRRRASSYGPLAPAKDETTGLELLALPAGFRYASSGWTDDPLDDGRPTPRGHDGMACFGARGTSTVRLVRNHEIDRDGAPFSSDSPLYDPMAPGGTTTLEFDARAGRWLGPARASLTGTVRNCAGGATPWGSWLTCEETLVGPGSGTLRERHGYVFEVPVDGRATARPLRALGRFVHEAVAVDPGTGTVYETEDAAESGFYRLLPRSPGDLAQGGSLEMLAVRGKPRLDLRGAQPAGLPLPVEWVPIERPDPDDIAGDRVFAQGYERGGAVFARLEGAFAHAGLVYFVSTSGGGQARGQVWAHDPRAQTLSLLYESPGAEILDYPDNVVVSPRGGIVLCEDGEGGDFLRGLSPDGGIFPLSENRVILNGERNGLAGDFTRSEFAGSCFDPSGRWLFVNVQAPGITLAITGPWEKGPL